MLDSRSASSGTDLTNWRYAETGYAEANRSDKHHDGAPDLDVFSCLFFHLSSYFYANILCINILLKDTVFPFKTR